MSLHILIVGMVCVCIFIIVHRLLFKPLVTVFDGGCS